MTKPKKPFTDIDRKKEQQQFMKRLQVVIKDLNNHVWHPTDKKIILNFNNCLIYSPYTSISELPYYTPNAPLAKVPYKIICLFSLIYYVISNWWLWQQEQLSSEDIDREIVTLEEIVVNGLDSYIVEGDLVKGYRLRKGE